MLSRCPQVRLLCTLATEKLGGSLSITVLLSSVSETLGTIIFTDTDSQLITLVSGKTCISHARDIKELIAAFQKETPGCFLFSIQLQISTPKAQRSELIPCAPMNPELIATAAKRMLRSMLLEK